MIDGVHFNERLFSTSRSIITCPFPKRSLRSYFSRMGITYQD
jgi:hypothetical protein